MNTTKTSKGKKGLIEYIYWSKNTWKTFDSHVRRIANFKGTNLFMWLCTHLNFSFQSENADDCQTQIQHETFGLDLSVWQSVFGSKVQAKPLASRLKCWTNPSQHNFFQTVSYILCDGQLSDTWTWETCDQHHKTNKVNEQTITSQEILWDFETTFQEMPLQWDFELTNIPRNGDTWVSDKLKCLTIIFSAHQAHVAVVSTQFFTYNIFPTLSPKFPAAGSPTSQSETTPGPKRKAISPAIVQCNWTCDWSHLGCEVY